MSVRSPILRTHEGGATACVRWEARVEARLAILIRDLLATDPPPMDCQVAADLREYAGLLENDAQARLATLADRPRLRSVSVSA
jgi:hypothetical protein